MIEMQIGRHVIAAYDGPPAAGHRLGVAIDNGRGTWTVRVGGTTRCRRRRRAAVRSLRKLAQQVLMMHRVAGSPLPYRREGIGGGVQTMDRPS